jgi:hypothetical protein
VRGRRHPAAGSPARTVHRQRRHGRRSGHRTRIPRRRAIPPRPTCRLLPPGGGRRRALTGFHDHEGFAPLFGAKSLRDHGRRLTRGHSGSRRRALLRERAILRGWSAGQVVGGAIGARSGLGCFRLAGGPAQPLAWWGRMGCGTLLAPAPRPPGGGLVPAPGRAGHGCPSGGLMSLPFRPAGHYRGEFGLGGEFGAPQTPQRSPEPEHSPVSVRIRRAAWLVRTVIPRRALLVDPRSRTAGCAAPEVPGSESAGRSV